MPTRRTLLAVLVGAIVLAGCSSPAEPQTAVVSAQALPPSPASASPATPGTGAAGADGSSAVDGHEHQDRPPEAQSLFQTTRGELMGVQAAQGSGAALALLEQRIYEVPELAGVCHAIAHELGHEAVERADGQPRRALKHGTEVCGGGFIHGVIETVLGSSTDPARDLLRVCAPTNAGSCFHGVGHGLMFATGMDVRAALDLCDGSPSRELSARCGEGVFMQLFSSDLSAQHVAGEESLNISHDPAAAQARCRRTRATYAANCWFYAPTVYLTVNPDDFAGAIRWCRASGTSLGRQLCARGVGSRAVKYHPDDLAVADSSCSAAGRLTDSCLQGMGSYWSVHHKGEVEPSDVCRHLEPSPLRKRCRSVV